MSYKALSEQQVKEITRRARDATQAKIGAKALLFVVEECLAQSKGGAIGASANTRTKLLQHLEGAISRAGLRKILLAFERKSLVVLEGSRVRTSDMLVAHVKRAANGAPQPAIENGPSIFDSGTGAPPAALFTTDQTSSSNEDVAQASIADVACTACALA